MKSRHPEKKESISGSSLRPKTKTKMMARWKNFLAFVTEDLLQMRVQRKAKTRETANERPHILSK